MKIKVKDQSSLSSIIQPTVHIDRFRIYVPIENFVKVTWLRLDSNSGEFIPRAADAEDHVLIENMGSVHVIGVFLRFAKPMDISGYSQVNEMPCPHDRRNRPSRCLEADNAVDEVPQWLIEELL